MARELPAGAIPITQVGHREGEPYRLFILSSLALAGLVGFILGIHVPLGRLLGAPGSRSPELIQVHGQVQLLGFAGLFVLGMSLRLMPRFAHSRLGLEGLIIPVWALMAGSLVTKALVLVWLPDGWHDGLAVTIEIALLFAAALFLLIVTATLAVDRGVEDGTSWFFLTGAWFFFLQALAGTFVSIKDAQQGYRTVPYLADTALIYLQLGGFLMAFVGGVATRAIPTMLGMPRPESGAKRTALILGIAVLTLSGSLLAAEYLSDSTFWLRLADVGLVGVGLSFTLIAYLSGALRTATTRLRPASQPHMRLVRSAFLWLTLAGLLSVYFGGDGIIAGGLPSVGHMDSLRHMVAVGTITTLILGMAMMIVPEFAEQRQGRIPQARYSLLLLTLLLGATILRVLPGLAADRVGSEARDGMFAAAGTLAEVAILAFGISLLRLTLRQR